MLVGTVFISFSAVFVELAHVGPTVSGFYRMSFGALFLFVFAVAKREALWAGGTAFWLAVAAGAFYAGELISWHRSIHYVGPGLSTILANFQVFFPAVVGALVFREWITRQFGIEDAQTAWALAVCARRQAGSSSTGR
jgi:drug/metabolite transporter (DMT)-like permease